MLAGSPENWLIASGRKWKRAAAGYLKGSLRRGADEFLPNRETREHGRWIGRRIEVRNSSYTDAPVTGLLSVMTAVWDGSPVKYLRALADSIRVQNREGCTEWVLLDNGCQRAELNACLRELSAIPWVKLIRSEKNLGITQGLRACLESASGRYVLPVDGDDLLDLDALSVVTSAIVKNGYSPVLYTDEDKVIGSRRYQPYFKPDWDPVLLLNSAYIAHLGVVDRELALRVGAYSEAASEASPDWDLFLRLLSAGYSGVHIPEVVYSWRVHAASTADDAASKPAVHASQQRVLQRYLDARPDGDRFTVEYNAFFGGAPHWRFRSKQDCAVCAVKFDDKNWRATLMGVQPDEGLVLLLGERVEIKSPDWTREIGGLFELHPDAVMVGGMLLDQDGRLIEAGQIFGFDGGSGSPEAGRRVNDPGYFGQMWKQRSVSAVSAHMAVIRADFLRRVLEDLPSGSPALLGPWAGAHALREGKRVIYTPFLSGIARSAESLLMNPAERDLFVHAYADLIPDHRYYSRFFSLEKPYGLRPAEQVGAVFQTIR